MSKLIPEKRNQAQKKHNQGESLLVKLLFFDKGGQNRIESVFLPLETNI